jgi:hypothetical protein
MENECYFVNSRGILKSCDIHSFYPQSSCNSDCNYLLESLGKMKDGMSIYVCSNLLSFFVNDVLPKMDTEFTLVSGDSDSYIPDQELTCDQIETLLRSPLLIKWFSQNSIHPEIIQIPIGLDYHSYSNFYNPWKTKDESCLPIDQEMKHFGIINEMKPFYERESKIYVNFSHGNDRFGQRRDCFQQISKELMVIKLDIINRQEYTQHISKYSFVLSPFGFGMDCHRTWEALCFGAIPIVNAPDFKELFEGLPVLNVNDWKDVTRELLDKTIEDFKHIEFNYDKLSLRYWVDQIKGIS